jgi:hypothetical protein
VEDNDNEYIEFMNTRHHYKHKVNEENQRHEVPKLDINFEVPYRK